MRLPESANEPQRIIDEIRASGLGASISLGPDDSIEEIEPHLGFLDLVCVLGTKIGIKRVGNLAEGTCEKITELVDLPESTGLSFEIEADGAIRRYTVPRLRRAGVDVVVPGSLMFDGDCAKTSQWLRDLNL